MYAPTTDLELAMLAGYADSQVDALHASLRGLTHEQAADHPARSRLSLGGLVRHTTWVLRQHAGSGRPGDFSEEGVAAFMDTFAFDDRHTVDGVLAELDAARADCRARTLASDPDEESLQPPAPWDGLPAMTATRRYEMLHLVEELARHAGHADILREQLDGALVPDLEAAEAGRSVWEPAVT